MYACNDDGSAPVIDAVELALDAGPNYEAIRREYIAGEMSIAALAKKHGVSFEALKRRAVRHGWADARREVGRRVRMAVNNVIAEKAETIGDVNVAFLALAREIRTQARQLFQEAAASGTLLTPMALRTLGSAGESAQRIANLALGISTSNEAVAFSGGVGNVTVYLPDNSRGDAPPPSLDEPSLLPREE